MSRGMAGQRDFKPHVTCWKMQVRRKPQYMDAQKRPDGRLGAGARHAALGRDAERGSVTTRGVDAGTGADLRRAATASAELG